MRPADSRAEGGDDAQDEVAPIGHCEPPDGGLLAMTDSDFVFLGASSPNGRTGEGTQVERDVKLYHISDKPGIKRFEPRPALSKSAKQEGLMVWAIDYEHLHNYLLPRDCPRVTFFAEEESDPKDVERVMGGTSAKHVVAIEARWLLEIQKQCLYQYEFDPKAFTLVDQVAGYWISRKPIIPIAETKIDDVLSALLEHDVELRIMPSLWKLREAVINSTLGYSIIRMNKAQPPPEGMEAYYPLP